MTKRYLRESQKNSGKSLLFSLSRLSHLGVCDIFTEKNIANFYLLETKTA